MNEIIKLVVTLTRLAEEALEYLERLNHPERAVQLHLPMAAVPGPVASDGPQSEVETMTPNPVEQPVEEPKKTRKPRAAKAATPPPPPPPAEEAAPAELTEEQSSARMMEITKEWVILAKNDTPKDGKTQAMEMLNGPAFNAAKLGDLTHADRLRWIALMEEWIAARK